MSSETNKQRGADCEYHVGENGKIVMAKTQGRFYWETGLRAGMCCVCGDGGHSSFLSWSLSIEYSLATGGGSDPCNSTKIKGEQRANLRMEAETRVGNQGSASRRHMNRDALQRTLKAQEPNQDSTKWAEPYGRASQCANDTVKRQPIGQKKIFPNYSSIRRLIFSFKL